MGQGEARLTVTIAGKDDASREIGKVAVSAEKLQASLNGASERGNQLTSSLRSIASGDVRGGLGGVAKLLGPGTGMAGAATLAAAGIAGVAAAVGVAAVKMTEWSIEVERLRAQMRFAFEGGEQEALSFADAIGGVAVESVVKLKTTLKAADVTAKLTVEQLQALTNAATVMGKTGDDALSAFADAIRTGSTRALRQVGVFVNGELAIKNYAAALGISSESMTAAQRSQAVLNATMEALTGVAQAGTDAYGRQDRALAELANSWTAMKLEISSIVSGPAVEIVESIQGITGGVVKLSDVARLAVRLITAPFRAMFEGFAEGSRALKLATERDFRGAAEAAASALLKLNPATGGLPQAVDDVAQLLQKLSAETEKTTHEINLQGAASSGLASVLTDLTKAEAEVVKWQARSGAEAAKLAAKRAAAAAAAKRAAAEAKRAFADFEAGIDALLTRGGEALDRNIEARAAAVQALQDRVLGVAFDTAATPEARAAAAQAQIQARMVAELERVKGDEYLRTAEKAQLSAAIQAEAQHQIMRAQADLADAQRRSAEEAIRLEEEQRAARLQTVDAYGSAAKTLAGVLFEADTAKRVSAGIDAAIETARSIAAFASYDIAGGIGHAAAAAAFAKVALTSAPTPAAAATAGPQRAPLQQPAQAASTGGGPLVVNITGGLGTPAEVGAAIRKAMRAVAGTGMGGAAAYGGA